MTLNTLLKNCNYLAKKYPDYLNKTVALVDHRNDNSYDDDRYGQAGLTTNVSGAYVKLDNVILIGLAKNAPSVTLRNFIDLLKTKVGQCGRNPVQIDVGNTFDHAPQ